MKHTKYVDQSGNEIWFVTYFECFNSGGIPPQFVLYQVRPGIPFGMHWELHDNQSGLVQRPTVYELDDYDPVANARGCLPTVRYSVAYEFPELIPDEVRDTVTRVLANYEYVKQIKFGGYSQ